MEELPEEINRQILIRLPYQDIPTVRSVCKSWKAHVEQPEFIRDRKATGHSQNVVVLPNRHTNQPIVSETDTGIWREIPPIPEISGWSPRNGVLVAVRSDLVVIGGVHPDTSEMMSCVFIYSFISGKWRRGADMPGRPRYFFGCASDSDRMVYVAGGLDMLSKVLRSALAYDVVKGTWTSLPDMAIGRCGYKGVFHRGKFHVLGGKCESRGTYTSVQCMEAFDRTTWQWDFKRVDKWPSTPCVSGTDSALYSCHNGAVKAWRGGEWEFVATLPADVNFPTVVAVTCRDKLFVIKHLGFGGSPIVLVLNLKELIWTKFGMPKNHTAYGMSSCWLEI